MALIKSLKLPDVVLNRLVALAEAKSATPERVAVEALQEFVSSPEARRAIRKWRRGTSLSDLGWTDGYEGRSADDILSFAETDSAYLVLDTLAAAIEQNWVNNPGSRTGVENDIVAVMALLREVGNGGFDQFFRNSSRRWAFFVKDSLIRIGRSDAAKIAGRAARAIGRIPGSQRGPGVGSASKELAHNGLAPARPSDEFLAGLGPCLRGLCAFDELDNKMSQPNPRRDDVLRECDQMFYQMEGLAESLLAYAQRHQTGILRD